VGSLIINSLRNHCWVQRWQILKIGQNLPKLWAIKYRVAFYETWWIMHEIQRFFNRANTHTRVTDANWWVCVSVGQLMTQRQTASIACVWQHQLWTLGHGVKCNRRLKTFADVLLPLTKQRGFCDQVGVYVCVLVCLSITELNSCGQIGSRIWLSRIRNQTPTTKLRCGICVCDFCHFWGQNVDGQSHKSDNINLGLQWPY